MLLINLLHVSSRIAELLLISHIVAYIVQSNITCCDFLFVLVI